MKKLLPILFILAIACQEPSTPAITTFTIYFGSDSVIATVKDSTITALIPYGVPRDSLLVKYNDSSLTINAEAPLRLWNYTITIKSFTGLPIVYINTAGPVTSKDTYVTGTLAVDGNTLFPYQYQTMQIKGRGNSTWSLTKKPYKIKLDSKAVMLGMPEDKEWALLANYMDKSLLRNDVAFELSNRLQMAWTPRRRFVEVVLNGEYNGQYLLTETVKSGKDRIASSDYQVEADYRHDGAQWFATPQGVSFVVKSPEPATAAVFEGIKSDITGMETKIANYKDIRGEADLDSWIKWMIVNELMRNSDAPLVSSCFWYKSGGKLFMGPVWDFDASAGSYKGNDAEGWYVNEGYWFGGLFRYHSYYKARFKEIWNQYRDTLQGIPRYSANQGEYLYASQRENYRRCDNIREAVRGDQVIAGSYEGEVTLLTDFLKRRFDWIDAQIQKF